MSIYFDGSGDSASYTGTIGSTTDVPITIGLWFHPLATAFDVLAMYGANAASITNSLELRTNTTPALVARTTEASTVAATTTDTYSTGTWQYVAGVFVADDERYCQLDSNTRAYNGSLKALSDTLDNFIVGRGLDSANDFYGYIAHVAMWKSALTQQNVDDLAGGANPLTIDADNLIAYWPMTDSGDVGADYFNAADLTLNGSAAYNAENPTVDAPPAGTKYLKLLDQYAAVGAVVNGVVFGPSTASPLGICGSKIGEFTNATFVDGSGSPLIAPGEAALLVDVTEFGGGSLTTSDNPVAIVFNATYTSGLTVCTVVE